MTLVRLTFQQLTKCNSRIIKYSYNGFIRWRGAVRACCFLFNYHQDQIKRKTKKELGTEIFKKNEQNKEFSINFCKRCVSMIENIEFQVICIMDFLAKVMKKHVSKYGLFLYCSWKYYYNCSTALQAFSFRSLFLYPLFSFS